MSFSVKIFFKIEQVNKINTPPPSNTKRFENRRSLEKLL